MIFGAAIFAGLKYFGIITLGWGWIIAAAIIGMIPMGKTGAFIALKLLGLFAVPVSWGMIAIPLVLDILLNVDLLHDLAGG